MKKNNSLKYVSWIFALFLTINSTFSMPFLYAEETTETEESTEVVIEEVPNETTQELEVVEEENTENTTIIEEEPITNEESLPIEEGSETEVPTEEPIVIE